MATNQTLQQAKQYTDDQLIAHVGAADPHPHYVRLLDGNRQSLPSGSLILLQPGDDISAIPPAAKTIVFSPGGVTQAGVYIANEALTGWVLLGAGPIPNDTTPPTMPGNFRATGNTTTSITVAWDASTDAGTGVGGYDVAIGSGAWIPLGNVTTYTFSGLTAGTSYAMKVRARDNATTPNLSTPATLAASTAATPLTAPRNLRVLSTTPTSITFAWDAPSQGTVASYDWRIGSGTFATNGAATTKQVTGLTPSTPYTFGVRAVDTGGVPSAEVTLTASTAAAGGGGATLIGLHVAVPTNADVTANPELAPVQAAGTPLGVLQYYEGKMNALTGFTDNPLMSIGHIFHGPGSNYVMKSWGTQQLARMPALVANFKPTGGANLAGLQQVVAGTDDTKIIALINSLPAGKRIYLILFHEPDETAGAFATAWRAAQVRWAQLILANRGGKDIHPMICLTTWSFRPANASTQAQFLQVEDDFTAAGIDWVTQVVMAPDGYEDKSTDAGNPPNAATTYADVFPTLVARGWRRLGITECATSSKAGASGNNTVTAADVTGAPVWMKSLIKYSQTVGPVPFEYVCWFNTTGSKGPVGSWQYTDAVRQVWGLAAHYKGPAPGW